MKIESLKPNPTTTVELIHAPGVFVTLSSRDATAVKAVIGKATEKRLAALRKGNSKPFSQADMEADSIAVLTAAVVGIKDTTEDPMPFTPETVAELLSVDWVRRQLDEAMGNDALFFGN